MWRNGLHQVAKHLKSRVNFNVHRSKYSKINSKLIIHNEVSEALLKNKPVISLESTIITHGMPFPHNLNTARSVIGIIRDNGVVPATVAIFNGKIHIGLTADELEYIAKLGPSAVKTSRRDIPAVLSKNFVGATTVSGTLVASAMAGIPIFVTGGIGGVHYGAEKTFDVSTDLRELGQTPVAVICAGIKSILNIGLTLEYLETCGVTVATLGEPSSHFPAFFTADSGFKAPYNVKTSKEAASMIDCNLEMEMKSGMVFGVPIPQSHSLLGSEIEAAVQVSLQNAKDKNVTGKDFTPFVLKEVERLTSGKSLEANIALIKNNAVVGSEIAVELSKIRETRKLYGLAVVPNTTCPTDKDCAPKTLHQPVIIGGSNIDFIVKANSQLTFADVTNAGEICQTYGGVARNIAECLTRIGEFKPLFISTVGADDLGQMLLKHLEEANVSTLGVYVNKECRTAVYSVILDTKGEVAVAVGDMDAHKTITAAVVSSFEEWIRSAPVVIMDGNVSEDVIEYCIDLCDKYLTPLIFEPTTVINSGKPFKNDFWRHISMTTPNINELRTMSRLVTNNEVSSMEEDSLKGNDERSLDDLLKECLHLCQPLMKHISTIVVTLGELGVLVCRDVPFSTSFLHEGKLVGKKKGNGLVSAVYFPSYDSAQDKVKVVSVTGAGDSFIAAFISSALVGHSSEVCVKAGLMAAWYSVQVPQAVSTFITAQHFTEERIQAWAPWKPNPLDLNGQ